MAWGKRKDGQPYVKNKHSGMSGYKIQTEPTSDIHLKEHSKHFTKEDYEHYGKCDLPLKQCPRCMEMWGFTGKHSRAI